VPETWTERTIEALRQDGYRAARARRVVVDVLSRAGCCVSVPQIVEAARVGGEPVGVASVYRILELLVEKGLVQKLDLGGNRAHYERIDQREHHHHLVCSECGRVEAFSDRELEAALEGVEARAGFAIASHDVLLRGACDDCRAA
jgi:Fur family transcriptional regulator, ferric uptake regulator